MGGSINDHHQELTLCSQREIGNLIKLIYRTTHIKLFIYILNIIYKDYGKKNCCRKLEDEQEPAGGYRPR